VSEKSNYTVRLYQQTMEDAEHLENAVKACPADSQPMLDHLEKYSQLEDKKTLVDSTSPHVDTYFKEWYSKPRWKNEMKMNDLPSVKKLPVTVSIGTDVTPLREAARKTRGTLYDCEEVMTRMHIGISCLHIGALLLQKHILVTITTLFLTRSNLWASAVSAHYLAGDYNNLYNKYRLVELGLHQQNLDQYLYTLNLQESEMAKRKPFMYNLLNKN